jgi:iron-sulfur cluster assembly protein
MIHVSDTASAHITKMLTKRGKGIGIRVGVKTTGCSGLAYVLEYVDTALETDLQYVHSDIVIVADPKHLAYLDEMTIDYVKKGLNEGFEFLNPKEKDRCGCGESFRV